MTEKSARSSLPVESGECFSWRFGSVEINEASRVLSREGQVIAVETKTFDLLLALVRRAGQVLGKEELLGAIWPGRIVTDSVLAKCVVKARVALGEQAGAALKTVHGVGYRLDAVVERRQPPSWTPSASLPPVTPATLQAGDVVPGRSHWRLHQVLAQTNEVWKVRHDKTGEQRVFKFAIEAASLEALQRELTINRLLRETYPGRPEFLFVSDWNFDAEPPYLEMPLVSGGSLSVWLEAQGVADGPPLPMRLELAAQAAEAVALAHAVGVLHRDLKPGNLLVDDTVPDRPQIKLADFGVGALTAQERLEALEITRMDLSPGNSASPAGTPAYLAPEVLAGQPQTERSDIYALGVLLYQLYVGDLRRPLAPGWERGIDDELLREDIAAAADQDPTHRLDSASELARRLRTLPERRTQRGVERDAAERLAAAEAALLRSRSRRQWAYGLAASLALGMVVSSLLYWEASRQRQAAERALATSEAMVDFLDQDLLSAANPQLSGGGRNVTVASLLDKAGQGLQERLALQPEAGRRLAFTIARSYQNLGLGEDGRRLLLRELEAAKKSDPAQLRPLRFLLADIDTELDRYEEAGGQLDDLLADLQKNDELRSDFAFDVRLSRSWLDFELGYYQRSQDGFSAILRDVQAWRPTDSDTRLTALWWSVDSLLDLNRLQEADEQLTEVLSEYSRTYGKDHARYLWARMSLGNLRIAQRRFDEAEAVLSDVEKRIRANLGEGHNIALYATYFRGFLRQRQGKVAEALPYLEESYRLRKQYHGEHFHATRLAANRLGDALLKLGDVEKAKQLVEPAYESSVQNFGLDHPYTLRLASTLAHCWLRSGQVAAASDLVRQALEHSPARLPPVHFTVAELLYRRAQVLLSQGSAPAARQSWTEAAEMYQKLGDSQTSELARRFAKQAMAPPEDWLRASSVLPI